MRDVTITIDGEVHKVQVSSGQIPACFDCSMFRIHCKGFAHCLCKLATENEGELLRAIFVKEQ